jgi:hypothetical protein
MDNDPIRQAILSDVDEVVARLACALTVAASASFQSDIRRFAGVPDDTTFVARLPSSHCWVLVSEKAPAGLVRQPPPGIALVDLDIPLAVGGPLRTALEKASDAEEGFQLAYGLLTPVFDATAPKTRAQVADLIPWAPTFEQLAVRISTRAVTLADALRKDMLAGLELQTPEAELRVREYAGLLRMMGDLQLLASDDGARPWLEGMAKSFQWQQWTPSWPLVRERVTSGIPAAAWAVQAIGPAIIDDYLDALVRSSHAMVVFDALFGLVALALSSPADARVITSEIKSRRGFIRTPVAAENALVDGLVGAAVEVITAPDKTKRQLADAVGFRGPLEPARFLPHVLAKTREHDTADPLVGALTPLAFAVLPVIFEGERSDAYPEEAMDHLPTQHIADAVRRAWGVGSRPRPVVH